MPLPFSITEHHRPLPAIMTRFLIALCSLLLGSLSLCSAQTTNQTCPTVLQSDSINAGVTNVPLLPTIACNSTSYATYIHYNFTVSNSTGHVLQRRVCQQHQHTH